MPSSGRVGIQIISGSPRFYPTGASPSAPYLTSKVSLWSLATTLKPDEAPRVITSPLSACATLVDDDALIASSATACEHTLSKACQPIMTMEASAESNDYARQKRRRELTLVETHPAQQIVREQNAQPQRRARVHRMARGKTLQPVPRVRTTKPFAPPDRPVVEPVAEHPPLRAAPPLRQEDSMVLDLLARTMAPSGRSVADDPPECSTGQLLSWYHKPMHA